MPRYTAHLVATDGSGHFRRTVLHAPNEERARFALMQREFSTTDFQLSDEEFAALEAEEAEKDTAGGRPDGRVRARLAMHRQAAPYEIEWIAEGTHLGRRPVEGSVE